MDVEARRQQLVAELHDQERRQTRRMHTPGRIQQIEAELDALLNAEDHSRLDDLAADVTAYLAA